MSNKQADIRPNGKLLELEVKIEASDVPSKVSNAASNFLLDFQIDEEKPGNKKSIRSSENGLPEIWQEFSNAKFGIEVQSDAKALLVELK